MNEQIEREGLKQQVEDFIDLVEKRGARLREDLAGIAEREVLQVFEEEERCIVDTARAMLLPEEN